MNMTENTIASVIIAYSSPNVWRAREKKHVCVCVCDQTWQSLPTIICYYNSFYDVIAVITITKSRFLDCDV